MNVLWCDGMNSCACTLCHCQPCVQTHCAAERSYWAGNQCNMELCINIVKHLDVVSCCYTSFSSVRVDSQCAVCLTWGVCCVFFFLSGVKQEQTPVYVWTELMVSCAWQLFSSDNTNPWLWNLRFLCHVSWIFTGLRGARPLFGILIARHTYQIPCIPIVSFALCSHFHVHLCLSSFLSPPKGKGKQKHLFTPLLGRRDLEGGSILSTTILSNGQWFTPLCSQLFRFFCVSVCVSVIRWGQRSVCCERSRRGVELKRELTLMMVVFSS